MIDDLIKILESKKLNIEILVCSKNEFILTFNVWAKPGARFEKILVSNEGVLVIQTRSKPVDGEANEAIVEAISDLMGVPKSQVEILRGDKSRLKKIKLQVIITANKKAVFFEQKFSAILGQAALD